MTGWRDNRHNLCRPGGVLVVCLVALELAGASAASAAAAERSFVLRARAVYPVTPEQPEPFEPGIVVVRDGKIAAVGGADVAIPADLPLLDLRDESVCPGYVAIGGGWVGPHDGPESVSGLYNAADAFNPYEDNRRTLARGITTTHLSPGGHRLVSGRSAVVKLGGPPEQRLLSAGAELAINFGAFAPPPLIRPPFYASSDVAIEPQRPQRPETRISQLLELQERIALASRPDDPEAQRGVRTPFNAAQETFAAAWRSQASLRVQARRAVDIESALAFLAGKERPAYLVVGGEAARLSRQLARAPYPVVVRIESDYRSIGDNLGGDPEAYDPGERAAAELFRAGASSLALAGRESDRMEDPRLLAALAIRGGLPRSAALAAITRTPAEILGLAQRIGSLAPGRDADLLILSGPPTSPLSPIQRVYVNGEIVFDQARDMFGQSRTPRTPAQPLVVRAGALWTGDGTLLRDASILIEDGRITAVGQRVPQPPAARVIDAGADAFVTPGFIDAHGHLGLAGDATVLGPDLPLHNVIGTATREFARVARAGITTVLLAGYRVAPGGGRVAAVKTYGEGRADMVAREIAGLKFSWRGRDPLTEADALRRVLESARRYDESWKKYEKELEEWRKARAAGAATTQPAPADTQPADTPRVDPITGRWDFTVSGGPIPEPASGSMTLRLTGDQIEGRMTSPDVPDEVAVTGRLDGAEVTLDVDQETPLGKPRVVARLDREDHMIGNVRLGQITVDFEATRVDKSAVEFRVTRARAGAPRDGRPTPPKVDENLEPLRPVLNGRAPVVLEADTAGQIAAALKLLVDDFKLSVVLLNALGAEEAGELLSKAGDAVGIVVPPEIVLTRERRTYSPAAALARRGLRVAFQSDAEDAARSLPLLGLYAVQHGLGGDDALRAFTVNAARMYKLEDRLGTLAPGKDADLLIFSGHPFDAESRLERVIVGGREVVEEPW